MSLRRIRSILVDNALGKVFTNVDDSAIIDASNVIAAPVMKTYQWSPASTSAKTIVAKNIGGGTGINFPGGALLKKITLTAVVAPKGDPINVVVKKGTSYATSIIIGGINESINYYSLFASTLNPPGSKTSTYPLEVTLAAGDSIFIDIIKVGTTYSGAGFGFQLGYFSV